ncbi:MAG: Lrp/AsnC family transcriptional regulator [Chloroflexota bacterium]
MAEHANLMPLDELDYQIILELRKDGRARAPQIARAIHANERTVRNRIDRLFEQGIVRLSAIVNPRAFGYITVVEVFLKVEQTHENDVISRLLDMQEIIYLAHGFGEQDLVLKACFKDNGEMRDFLRQTLPSLPGVTVARSVFIPRILRTLDEWQPKPEDFLAKWGHENGNGLSTTHPLESQQNKHEETG